MCFFFFGGGGLKASKKALTKSQEKELPRSRAVSVLAEDIMHGRLIPRRTRWRPAPQKWCSISLRCRARQHRSPPSPPRGLHAGLQQFRRFLSFVLSLRWEEGCCFRRPPSSDLTIRLWTPHHLKDGELNVLPRRDTSAWRLLHRSQHTGLDIHGPPLERDCGDPAQCRHFWCSLCQHIRHLRNDVRRSKLEGIPQIAISRIHPLFDCLVIVWQWRDDVQIWWTISAPRPGLRCTAPSQLLGQCIALRCNLVQLCHQLLHFRDFVPWTTRRWCAARKPPLEALQLLFAIPQLLLQPDSFVLCFPQRFVGSGQPVPRSVDKLGTSVESHSVRGRGRILLCVLESNAQHLNLETVVVSKCVHCRL